MTKNFSKKDLIKVILEDIDDSEMIEEDIIHMIINEKVAKDVSKEHEKHLTFGDRMSDKLAEFAGSWVFIIGFGIVLFAWIIANSFILKRPYDPYPFILLNLILSCLAAIQAPIIMMSQNRQEAKDRIRSKNDYKVNLKSELIIEDLHKKIDELQKLHQELLNKIDTLNKM
ncbi:MULTISPECIES: DUF1003 domain-containing protein [unclassified Thermoanaerobacterium]|jgi:uncharacterized membrane protein|uniref:DUF1003 domain-containing protein n=1 Tax=unclassified Thermoanaerobacterium TaxID=2622527 RepID=UPI000A161D7D|nr:MULTISPECIES: DUF1003 domain-containing protein [unclassified Thermoanaerobacterium]MDE4543037.1 DUF1003 domain-containing protein [Thermoanaerobacterium sp. R66]ORX22820.1 hypothetical protein BVF91_10140 [Thermoanaerobacterium sp. PSU-2]HHV74860.1 DUF1003 domain-containing protein [Thermoanaerobacterium sp.]